MSNWIKVYMIYEGRDIYGDFSDAEDALVKDEKEAILWAQNTMIQLRESCHYYFRINGGKLYHDNGRFIANIH